MDTIEALRFQYDLNKYIEKCLKLNLSYPEIWEVITDEGNEYCCSFRDFLGSRIGPIWLKKLHGQKFLEWQAT